MSTLLQKISIDVLMLPLNLKSLIGSAPKRYKMYKIPKRKQGEFRTIAQPSREVKKVQYWLLENVLKDLPVHEAATANQKGQSIRKNAEIHKSNRFLLKLDFRDFFPSLRAVDFELYLKKLDPSFPLEDIELLSKALFWKSPSSGELVLSIGAPTSPRLSNLMLYDFDRKIFDYCKAASVIYTRDADDMTFSTNIPGTPIKVEKKVQRICRSMASPYLRLNAKKTVYCSKKNRRRVTGLIISNEGKISLGREKKRLISATLHRFLNGRLDNDEISHLKGLLAYAHDV